ncbi:MAG: discoidin domain-containing protein, partial [Muribaculaceae bacterium]|nr:discoidin domain-containing protein [Muribaculaceae bacterium]
GEEYQYSGPITIDSSCILAAQAERNGQRTPSTGEQLIISKSTFRPVTLSASPSKKYSASGSGTLTDGRIGTNNYKSGEWMGFRAPDVTATIDLGESTPVSSLTFNALIANEKWIFAPNKWEVATSTDGITFTPVSDNAEYTSEVIISKSDSDTVKNGIIAYTATFSPVDAQYVRLTLVPEPSMPEWHDAAGQRAFVFIDEIAVN